MLAVLNRTCTDFGRLFGFHVHWTTAARQPIDKVSERLKFAIPIRMKRKFTDIVPDMPGRRTLKVEHRRAIAEKPKNPSKSSDCPLLAAHVRQAIPDATTSAIYAFVGSDKDFIRPSVL